ncbi:PWWP domain-containing protein, partial [Cephalotus follicularis]
ESDELNLVVDLHTYVGDGGDKSRDMDAEMTASKPGFCVSDLVWGKVRSHPWWPGQIFDASAASVKAKKYFKKDGYLIAYFGDQTFAWNEASRIKPFRPHFSQMEKQSSSPDFHYAVSCALEEVSRRVELGLACSCISEEVYAKIKTQIIVNAGIREESSRREVGDIFSSAASFEPVKPIGFIKELARQPLGGVDKMEFTTAHAQLQAFYLWKGYTQLPEVKMLGGLLESDEDIPLLSEVKHGDKLTEDASPGLKNDEVTENVAPEKGKLKSQDGSSGKRKHISGNSMHPSKKEKSLLELMAERRSSVSNGKKGSDSKTGCKLISSYSGKKRKLVESISDDYVEKLWKGQVSLGTDKSSQVKQTFRVGNSILKVASQLNGGSPVLKNSAEIAQKTAVNRSKEKSLSRRSQGENHLTSENSSDEILSQLFLAARDPMRKHSFLISIVSFFSKFRNSVSLDPSGARDHEQSSAPMVGGDMGENLNWLENTEASELDNVRESYCTDRILVSVPEGQLSPKNQNEGGEFQPETPSEKGVLVSETQAAIQLSPTTDFERKIVGGNQNLEAGKPVGHLENSQDEETSPTALILNFTDLDSVPSETNLNSIFSRYGPLNESETEVLKKSSRAKVVFKRRADAETAFSSAGKYSTFGPSLVSYRLRYMPSTPSKASPNPKRSRKDATPVERNA